MLVLLRRPYLSTTLVAAFWLLFVPWIDITGLGSRQWDYTAAFTSKEFWIVKALCWYLEGALVRSWALFSWLLTRKLLIPCELLNKLLLLGVRMQIVKIKSALRPPNDLSLVHKNGISTILRCVRLIFCSFNLTHTTHDYVLSIT